MSYAKYWPLCSDPNVAACVFSNLDVCWRIYGSPAVEVSLETLMLENNCNCCDKLEIYDGKLGPISTYAQAVHKLNWLLCNIKCEH